MTKKVNENEHSSLRGYGFDNVCCAVCHLLYLIEGWSHPKKKSCYYKLSHSTCKLVWLETWWEVIVCIFTSLWHQPENTFSSWWWYWEHTGLIYHCIFSLLCLLHELYANKMWGHDSNPGLSHGNKKRIASEGAIKCKVKFIAQLYT